MDIWGRQYGKFSELAKQRLLAGEYPDQIIRGHAGVKVLKADDGVCRLALGLYDDDGDLLMSYGEVSLRTEEEVTLAFDNPIEGRFEIVNE